MSKFKEVWADIAGYDGLYHVSNAGRVLSLRRYDGRGIEVRGGILKPNVGTTGYLYVNLRKDGRSVHKKIHRLVAAAFLRPEAGRYVVNHRDGNKLNNRIDNLEWCTQAENVAHAFGNGFMVAGENQEAAAEGRKKPVVQYDATGNRIARYSSNIEAARLLGIHPANISQCCNGKIKTSHGYIWKFEKETAV